MAVKKKSTRATTPTAAQLAAARKSSKELSAAHKRLEIALKKHKKCVSPMWFIG